MFLSCAGSSTEVKVAVVANSNVRNTLCEYFSCIIVAINSLFSKSPIILRSSAIEIIWLTVQQGVG